MLKVVVLSIQLLMTAPAVAQLVEPTKIAPFSGVVRGFSGDSRYVIVTANQTTDGGDELYQVPIDSSTPPQKLSATVPSDRTGVRFLQTSPNGVYVAYLHDVNGPNVNELWIASSDGSLPATRIATFFGPSFPLVGGSLPTVQFTPDSAHVVFRAQLGAIDVEEVWSSPVIPSPTVTRLSRTNLSHGKVRDFVVSPSGERLLFDAEVSVGANRFWLWSTPIGGGAITLLSGQGEAGATTSASSVVFLPDSQKLVFPTVVLQPFSATLWHTSVAGGTPTKLSGDTGTTLHLSCDVSQDGANLIFLGGTGFFSALFVRNLASGETTKVFEVTGPSGYVECGSFSNDNSRSYEFLACPEGDSAPCNLYRIAANGTSLSLVLSGVRSGAASSSRFRREPIESGAVQILDVASGGGELFELRALDRSSKSSWKLSDARNPARYFGGFPEFPTFCVKTSDHQIVFLSSHGESEPTTKALWAVDRSGSTPKKLTGTLPPGQGVLVTVGASFAAPSFSISPDGRYVVFVADRALAGAYEIWSAPLLPELLNVDRSADDPSANPFTDGLYIVRYMLGLRGEALFTGSVSAYAFRNKTQIEAHIQSINGKLDVDRDGQVVPTTDGLLILRRLLGFSGASLLSGASNSNLSPQAIEANIDLLKQ
ncbi:MAG: hypothetical protein ACRCWJ_07770 [Casimicrobium sp.]